MWLMTGAVPPWCRSKWRVVPPAASWPRHPSSDSAPAAEARIRPRTSGCRAHAGRLGRLGRGWTVGAVGAAVDAAAAGAPVGGAGAVVAGAAAGQVVGAEAAGFATALAGVGGGSAHAASSGISARPPVASVMPRTSPGRLMTNLNADRHWSAPLFLSSLTASSSLALSGWPIQRAPPSPRRFARPTTTRPRPRSGSDRGRALLRHPWPARGTAPSRTAPGRLRGIAGRNEPEASTSYALRPPNEQPHTARSRPWPGSTSPLEGINAAAARRWR